MSPTDTIVIGGGIIGAACARQLQRIGRQVTLIDADRAGQACSFGNAGLVALDHILPLARPGILFDAPRMLLDRLGPLHLRWSGLPGMLPWLTRFAWAANPVQVRRGTRALAGLLRESVPAWQRLADAADFQPLLRQQGYLTVFETEKSAQAAEPENRLLREFGIQFEMLSPDRVKSMAPAIGLPTAGGRYHPEAMLTVDPYGLVRHLLDRFSADGGTVIEGQRVTGFLIESGAVTGVELPSGPRRAARLVVAAGAGSPALARQLGIKAPLAAERGYHIVVPQDGIAFGVPLLFAERGFVATPMEAGLRLAGTVELGGGAPNWARADILRRHAETLFNRPGLEAISRWFGDRPTLPDYLPIIGNAPRHDNVTLAFGHQHLGLTLAAITAELVAELSLKGTTRQNLAAVSATRFG